MISTKKLLYKIVESLPKSWDVVYPVGSFYETSDVSFDPNVTWGGTWILESEGKVHIGAGSVYTIGSTGGETTHKLTATEIPSHNHGQATLAGEFNTRRYGTSGSGTSISWTSTSDIVTIVGHAGTSSKINAGGVGSDGGYDTIKVNATHTHTSVGGNGAHNNMQPYVAVNRWHRTA